MKEKLMPLCEQSLARAAAILHQGGVVAFPTETYYGLAADPFHPAALERLFQVKKRPASMPVLVLIARSKDISLFAAQVPPMYPPLMHRFWPGPLSLVFPALPTVPSRLTAGQGAIALRHSSSIAAQKLLQAFGGPLTATSANRSGEQPITHPSQLSAEFAAELDLILDGGSTAGQCGSTLVTWEREQLICLRPGQIDFSLVQAELAARQQTAQLGRNQ